MVMYISPRKSPCSSKSDNPRTEAKGSKVGVRGTLGHQEKILYIINHLLNLAMRPTPPK